MKRRFCLLLGLMLMLCLSLALADEDPILFQKFDQDEKLIELKLRLYELGYFTSDKVTDLYTVDTVERVKLFQQKNGLPRTGVIRQSDWDAIFSAGAIPNQPDATPKPTPSPTATPAPKGSAPTGSTSTPQPTEEAKLVYRVGRLMDEGMMQMNKRLYALGYLADMSFSGNYTNKTEKAVKLFQQANGLEVTGWVTTHDLAVLYADDAISAYDAGIYPSPTPLCTQRPLQDEAAPALDKEGYLTGEDAYVYENDEVGQWVYRTENIQVTINRYENTAIPLVWFESEIKLRGGEMLRSIRMNESTKRKDLRFSSPAVLATDRQLIFGFTDDFVDYRFYHSQTPGIVIRDGEIISSKTYSRRMRRLPNLDMMAQYSDGSLICYGVGEITAEELLEKGAINVYCFGPAIIRGGEIDECLNYKSYLEKFPRQFLGMIEPNHYLVLTVSGRIESSKGISCQNAATMLLARHVTEALNLDGGNTMAIVFRGRMLNKAGNWKNAKYIRSVSSLIGVGLGEYTAEPEDAVREATHP